jgi:hypothetical protein
MIVDVTYQGLSLVRGANARDDAGGLFIELEAPMPVGTRLEVALPDGVRAARVERVTEGAGAGVLVKLSGAAQADTPKAPASAEPNAPIAEMKSAPPTVTVDAAPEDEESSAEPSEPEETNGKKRRKKPRKTVIGH